MSEKKNKILELNSQVPPLTRKQIAERVPCTASYVTATLGATKTYKKREKKNETLGSAD